MPQIVATAICGRRTSSASGRPAGWLPAAAAGLGLSRNANRNGPSAFSPITARYAAKNGTAVRPSVARTMAGPMIAAANPPAMTQLIARGA